MSIDMYFRITVDGMLVYVSKVHNNHKELLFPDLLLTTKVKQCRMRVLLLELLDHNLVTEDKIIGSASHNMDDLCRHIDKDFMDVELPILNDEDEQVGGCLIGLSLHADQQVSKK